MDFMAGELQQQLRAVTGGGGSGTEAPAEPPPVEEGMEMCRRLVLLSRTLSPRQLLKQEEDEEMAENVSKIHEMGHALTDATKQMGAPCVNGVCKQEGEDDETEDEKQEREEEEAAKQEEEEAEAAKQEETEEEKAERAEDEKQEREPGTEPATMLSRRLKRKGVLSAIKKVGRAVAAIDKAVTSFDKRLRKQESRPAAIGRPVRSPDKTLGGVLPDGGTPEQLVDAISKMADETNDPKVAEALRKEAATLSIKSIHREARSQ